jgi:hypothetical protein
MTNVWLIEAKNFPSAPGVWGESITVPLATLVPTGELTSVRVRKAIIPLVLYNVVTDNRTVSILVGGTLYTVHLIPGYYSGSQLLTEIKTFLNDILVATTYSVALTFDSNTFLVTIEVTDSSIPGPVAFTLTTTTTATLSPSILTMLGFVTDPLVSTTGTELSSGPLNVVTDRFLILTCDEAKGKHGVYESLSTSVWHNGIIATIPIEANVSVGDVVTYTPELDSKWVNLVRGNAAGNITLRLARGDYSTMGASQVSWVVELEVSM